jgi:hypothetical protein
MSLSLLRSGTTGIVPLSVLQRRFRTWLTEPDEDRSVELARGLHVGPGLAVYQNNYRATLVEALRASHPRAAQWLGDAAFAAAAAHHIDAHPPTSWTIDAYGTNFAEALRPIDPLAADLAAIDHAIGAAFVAADAEPIAAAALAGVDWERAVIRPVPALALVPIATNADAIWLAQVAGDAMPAPAATPGTALVWRQGFEPVMRRGDALECRILRRSLDGAAFAAICAELANEADPAEAVTRAGTTLGRWLGESLIAGFA